MLPTPLPMIHAEGGFISIICKPPSSLLPHTLTHSTTLTAVKHGVKQPNCVNCVCTVTTNSRNLICFILVLGSSGLNNNNIIIIIKPH